jgi:hypothetical protein
MRLHGTRGQARKMPLRKGIVMTETREGLLRVLHARDQALHARPNEREAAREEFDRTAEDVERSGVPVDLIAALRNEVYGTSNTRSS